MVRPIVATAASVRGRGSRPAGTVLPRAGANRRTASLGPPGAEPPSTKMRPAMTAAIACASGVGSRPTIRAVPLGREMRWTRMELRFVFESREQMEQMEGLGAFDGIPQSVGQMDDVLAQT